MISDFLENETGLYYISDALDEFLTQKGKRQEDKNHVITEPTHWKCIQYVLAVILKFEYRWCNCLILVCNRIIIFMVAIIKVNKCKLRKRPLITKLYHYVFIDYWTCLPTLVLVYLLQRGLIMKEDSQFTSLIDLYM